MTTYSEFEIRLLPALVEAAEPSGRGQCEALEVAETVSPGVKEQWMRDAVGSYEQEGYLGVVSRPLDGTIGLTVSGKGGKEAERRKA